MLYLYLGAFLAAAMVATAVTWWLRNTALVHGWVARPTSERHLHTTGIPRLGGVAIVFTVLAVTACAVSLTRVLHLEPRLPLRTLALILTAGLLSFAAGLRDDLVGIRPWVKIAVQVIAGTLLFVGHTRVLSVSVLFGSRHFGEVTSLLLTIGWVVLISNAFNLIDGLDGLAAGSALFSMTTVFVVAMVNGSTLTALLTATLAGALLGFLRYNFNPATIFLGDCGSLFVGCVLSGLALTGVQQQKSSTLVAVAIPIVAFGLPILETTVSIVRRFLSGQAIFTADREHIHHKLLELGCSQRKAVVLLYAASALFGLMSLLLLSPGTGSVAVVLVFVGAGVVLGVQHLGYHEFFELGRLARRTLEQKQIIVNNLSVRRGVEKLARCKNFNEVASALEETFCANDFDEFTLTAAARKGTPPWKHAWTRPQSLAGAPDEWSPRWTLTLILRARDGRIGGELLLTRRRSSPLLLDVNLLILEYAAALSRACERVAQREPLQMPVRYRALSANGETAAEG